ncbi:MAG: GTP pyrophosphokinase [Firmicutes bacterium ADurb.Bin193]|nr:MAG: GTP pyrophosphokinase [Firmicutes bacterium ADurb.Bin193]
MNKFVYLEDVAEEMQMTNDESSIYYNTETGEFVYYSEYYSDDDIDPVEFEEDKYISLPSQHDIGEYDMMEHFADNVRDNRKRELLLVALEGKGAFRRFKDTLDRVDLREEWYHHRDKAYIEVAREWCVKNEISYKMKKESECRTGITADAQRKQTAVHESGNCMLSKAIEIASKAHAGQVDKGGSPYILHPIRVMMNCESESAKICAILHDVIEDTNITFDDLRKDGFTDEIITALECLTKLDSEHYDDFISRVITNEIACLVKLADLADNMDLTRIQNPSAKDEGRIKKYGQAADRISKALPYADEIPDCRLTEISGVVETYSNISSDQFCDMFIRFIESHGWFFGGGFKDITDEN